MSIIENSRVKSAARRLEQIYDAGQLGPRPEARSNDMARIVLEFDARDRNLTPPSDPNPTPSDMRVLALETVKRSLRQSLSASGGNEAKVWVMVAEHAASIIFTIDHLDG